MSIDWEDLGQKLLSLCVKVLKERGSKMISDRAVDKGLVEVLKGYEIKNFETLSHALVKCIGQNAEDDGRILCSEMFDLDTLQDDEDNTNMLGYGGSKVVSAFDQYGMKFALKLSIVDDTDQDFQYSEISMNCVASLAGLAPFTFCHIIQRKYELLLNTIEERVNIPYVEKIVWKSQGNNKVNGPEIKALMTSLHKLGISHGDVKPDNMGYFDKSKKFCFIDFGRSVVRMSQDDAKFHAQCMFDWFCLFGVMGDLGEFELVTPGGIVNMNFDKFVTYFFKYIKTYIKINPVIEYENGEITYSEHVEENLIELFKCMRFATNVIGNMIGSEVRGKGLLDKNKQLLGAVSNFTKLLNSTIARHRNYHSGGKEDQFLLQHSVYISELWQNIFFSLDIPFDDILAGMMSDKVNSDAILDGDTDSPYTFLNMAIIGFSSLTFSSGIESFIGIRSLFAFTSEKGMKRARELTIFVNRIRSSNGELPIQQSPVTLEHIKYIFDKNGAFPPSNIGIKWLKDNEIV